MRIFKLEKWEFYFYPPTPPPRVVVAFKPPHPSATDHCLHEIRPRHSAATMAQLLLHHAFQGSPLLWDYGEGSHIFLLAKSQMRTPPPPPNPYPNRQRARAGGTRTMVKTSGPRWPLVGTERASKSRWHIRVTPNSAAAPLSVAKATRSVTSAPAGGGGTGLVGRCLLLLL